jgi:hypothetical protein
MVNVIALVDLWASSNKLFGIGMHPMWVIKPVTTEESIYAWGFSDIKWAGVLAAYGLIGFLLVIISQAYYGVISFKILKYTNKKDIYVLFVIFLFTRVIFDIINYTYGFTYIGLWGPSFSTSFLLTAVTYKYEYLKD